LEARGYNKGMSILAADIGNSTISIGILKGTEIDVYRMLTLPVLNPPDYRKKLMSFLDISRVASVTASVLCSVVPEVVDPLAEAMGDITGSEPMIVDNTCDSGLTLDIDNPEGLGSDRIATAAGALSLADPPIAILDFGTATTVNFIDPGPDSSAIFRGGAILPGLRLMGQALATNASQLQQIHHGGAVRLPGRNTEDSILAGITYATAGGSERILEEVEQATGLKYRVMATGGMLEYAAAYIRRPTKRQPALTLRGLFSIYERSTGL